MSYKPFVEREDLGVALHTALRKLCDSTPTSIQWNAFDLMPNELFGLYLDAVWDKLKEVDSKEKALEAIKSASLDFYVKDCDVRRKLENTTQWTNLITCTFRLFDDEDWSGYTYWVVEGDN